jgi:hypothetical protein
MTLTKKLSKMPIYVYVLMAIGIFFFIPDPLDFLFGIGSILEAIAGILGIILAIKKVNTQ